MRAIVKKILPFQKKLSRMSGVYLRFKKSFIHNARILWGLRYRRKYSNYLRIMEEDWDQLIILDACRYDIFKQKAQLSEGNLQKRISLASHSIDFCKQNFQGESYEDTVYVTANGHAADICSDVFHDFVFTDKSVLKEPTELLHSNRAGISPKTVREESLKVANQYEKKRHIMHFMQPHDPYFGEKAEKLRSQLESEGVVIRARNPEKVDEYNSDEDNVFNSLAGAAEENYISYEELREVYEENLEFVLEEIRALIEELDGKIVITSDHGELLGESNKVGHPRKSWHTKLREVPWFVLTADERPNIIRGKSEKGNDIPEKDIKQRLELLGYE